MAEKILEILDLDGVNRALTRIAHEILEKNQGVDDLLLIGIRTGGAYLATQLQKRISEIEGTEPPLGIIDVTMYRDDLGSRRDLMIGQTEIHVPVTGKKVVLVDDVLYTGRTIRAALEAVIALGRPENIQLAILLDRGHRELPIRPDYIGRNIPTAKNEQIKVDFDAQNIPQAVHLLRN
ncbi:pyrimidine operon attenuation protein / uracil phosphoribosyltransferase [Desulfuromusa kysingii]|uniref:Bifunctional protein PyrR n=1 Tax=Desulfuromusa kysingii TaxID=37625 RepID=A0A1H4BJ69_9BACT|nr:bifunctional pyr operon transcriptional regulator/uracil phosphoribosyltransferase PyrR [Desulfuromusa kysingii]SEA48104.1 pyrimidine operon attenuation protein / uracil phosphoribosyltransferase [Desulfuromusa kysingii]